MTAKETILLSSVLFLFTARAFTAENRVLELDGNGSYVELPANIFNDLEEATVEGWVKWDDFGAFSRFFDFGEEWRSMNVTHVETTPTLGFHIMAAPNTQERIEVAGILQTNQWCHIAAVSGKSGMKLFFNGLLIGTNASTSSFATLRSGKHNYLGKSNWTHGMDRDFQGQMDEVRVWKVARSAEQIRGNMFKTLTGKEPDLVGLWNFDDGGAQDVSPGAHHGKLVAEAKCVAARLPSEAELSQPSFVLGKITDADGKPLPFATVILEQAGAVVATTRSDSSGNYRIAAYATNDEYEVSAAQGSLREKQPGVRLRPGDQQVVNLALKPNISLAGIVTALDGTTPLPAVVVQVVKPPTAQAPERGKETGADGREIVATVNTDAQGKFQFIDLKPGSYQVRCQTLDQFVYHRDASTYEVEKDTPIQHVDFQMAPFKLGAWRSFTEQDGLAGNQVNAIEAGPDGTLWFATGGGVSQFDGKKIIRVPGGLAGTQINTVYRSSDGALWFGTQSGLLRCDEKTRKVTHFTAADGLADNNINTIAGDHAGVLWIGTDLGISLYDGKDFKELPATNGPNIRFVSTIAASADGAFWVGTYGNGIMKYDGKISSGFSRQNGLPDHRVRAILCADKQTVWIGTRGNGVARFDGTNFVNLSQKDGLVDDRVNAVCRDSGGVLWFGTEGGVSRHNGKTFVNFTTTDGLAGKGVLAIHQAPDGAMWFATRDGVSRYNPKDTSNVPPAQSLPPKQSDSALERRETENPSGPDKTFAGRKSVDLSESAVELKRKWQIGNRYIYRLDVLQTIDFKFPQMPKPMRQDFAMAQVYALSVLKQRDGGGCELDLEFLAQELTVRQGDNVFVDFDSKGESTGETKDPLAPTLRKMTGTRLKYILNADNKVESIDAFGDYVDKVTSGSPPEGKGFFTSIYSEDYFKRLVDYSSGFLTRPKNPGASRRAQTDLTMWLFGTVVLDFNSTFKGSDLNEQRQCELIQFSGPITSRSTQSGIMGNLTIEEGRAAGKLWFDPQLGAIVESQIDQLLFAKMGSPTEPGSAEISQSIGVKLVDMGTKTE